MPLNDSLSGVRERVKGSLNAKFPPYGFLSLMRAAFGPVLSNSPVDPHNEVIFRFDDVPYDAPENKDNLVDAELAIMDLFLKENQKISLALVTNYLEESHLVVDRIKAGVKEDLFELAIHGWEHSDFSVLTQVQQERLLLDSNLIIENIFGRTSDIFIPPYNSFNFFTLRAMEKSGIGIISSHWI